MVTREKLAGLALRDALMYQEDLFKSTQVVATCAYKYIDDLFKSACRRQMDFLIPYLDRTQTIKIGET